MFRNRSIIRSYKKGLIIVCLSLVLVPLTVGALKAVTNIPCPKNITHYSGHYPYVTLFKNYPENFKQQRIIKCYPAGHASGGLTLMSLFFQFKRRRNRIIALVSSITIGWVTGGYKMLIGDHFLSHTLITKIFAGLIIFIISRFVKTDINLNIEQSIH